MEEYYVHLNSSYIEIVKHNKTMDLNDLKLNFPQTYKRLQKTDCDQKWISYEVYAIYTFNELFFAEKQKLKSRFFGEKVCLYNYYNMLPITSLRKQVISKLKGKPIIIFNKKFNTQKTKRIIAKAFATGG